MKRFVLGAVGYLLAIAAGAAQAADAAKPAPAAVEKCRTDGEIAAAERAPIEKAGMAFFAMVLGPKPESAYSMLARDAQGSMSVENFSAGFKAVVTRSGPFANPKVVHTYVLQTAPGKADTRIVCGSTGGTNWVSLAARPGMVQAHIVVAAQSHGDDWESTIWLVPDGNVWRVQYFHIGLSGIAGRSPADILQLARQQRDLGHGFNAAMLYASLQEIVDRGPAFQLGVVQSAQADYGKFKIPPELQGQPPLNWKMKGAEYRVGQAGIVGVEGRLALTFALPQAAWNGDEDANKRNHAFLDAFVATHPDYAETFAVLEARAIKSDGSVGYTTVYQSGKGYK